MNANKHIRLLWNGLIIVTIIILMFTNIAGVVPAKHAHAQDEIIDIYINDSGGECSLVGNWDNDTKTCQMTTDVYVTMAVYGGITLDGNSNSIIGPWDDTRGIVLLGDNITIKDVNVRDFGYCSFSGYASRNLTITGGIFEHCGMFLSGNNMRIEGNHISGGGGRAIELQGNNNSILRNVIVDNSEGGILLYESDNNLILENDILNTTEGSFYYGMWVLWSDGNIIEGNNIQGHYNSGISIDFSTGNMVRNNLITGGGNGLNVSRQSTSNDFYGNTIQGNWSPLKIGESTDNRFYNNNFLDNGDWIWVQPGNIFQLDLPIGGNYWSTFDEGSEGCFDLNMDGLCDSPYVFSGGQDNLPWAYRNGWKKHPPEISALVIPPSPVPLIQSINAIVTFSDPNIGDTHSIKWDWGDGSITTASATAPSVTTSHTYTSTGVYTVTVTITDAAGEADTETFQYVVVYDPTGGFVTGGGWINSPLGAYTPNQSLTGKATFGFVSKYQKGATVPTGNTEFQFHVAGMNFKSTSYDWLVVAGTKAQYKGTGTINGAGEYKFMLTAIDGTPDKFRIKIWDAETGEVIYDNQLGASDISSDATELGGGSIVIHKPK